MATKPLLLYFPIYNSIAEQYVNDLLTIPSDEDSETWINSPGGSVFAGYSILGPLNERTGKNNAKVFGSADSMIAYMLMFMDRVEALDTASFTLHRADGYIETPEDQKFLDKVNGDLRAKMEKKFNSKIFKEVTGVSINKMFTSEERIDINIDAKQALAIGLINKIIRLNPKQIAAMSNKLVGFSDFNSEVVVEDLQGSKNEKQETIKINNKKEIKMENKSELKANRPALYNEIYNEGVEAGMKAGMKAGAKAEKDRIEAFLEFVDIDVEAVKKGITEGAEPSRKFYAEMTRKSISAETLKKVEKESPEDIEKPSEIEAKTKANIEAEANEAEAMKAAGIKNYKPVNN